MNFLNGIKEHGAITNKYASAIAAAARKWGLSEMLIYYQAFAESGFRPDAVSSAGAVGLMQLLPSTAKMVPGLWSLKMPISPLTDPAVNLNLGAALMRWLFNEAGKYTGDKKQAYKIALASYLSGTSPQHIRDVAEKGFTASEQKYISAIIRSDINGADWSEIQTVRAIPSSDTGKSLFLHLVVGLFILWASRK